MQEATSLAKMVNIEKYFGAVQALKKVNIEVRSGEILGLLGDNGAGKSTLIKILAGVFPPDRGEIFFEGGRVNFSSPKDARAMGIETVHQALSLVDIMSISRNFFLGREPTRRIGP
ncbi:ATP-binding cassette domain-containing protein, partial [bacterium]|nr:ATP-binding cassette domain-containing protein [bacterium]